VGPPTFPLLLVTDAGQDTVHVIDVVHYVHAGYMTPPGVLVGPRGIAAWEALVAVSTWKECESPSVVLFQKSGTDWIQLRELCPSYLESPCMPAFTDEGTHVVVTEFGS
jgi:hypothetical protein